MTSEVFKDIEMYKGLYQVTSLGRVFALPKVIENKGFLAAAKMNSRFLKICDNGRGYKSVTISIAGKRKNHYVHRLVATQFLPNPNNYTDVNHIDGNKANNCVLNLEWCSRDQNRKHAMDTGLMSSGINHVGSISVKCESGIIYPTIKLAATANDVNYGTLKWSLKHKGFYKNLQLNKK